LFSDVISRNFSSAIKPFDPPPRPP
jgi:hypothetical protein